MSLNDEDIMSKFLHIHILLIAIVMAMFTLTSKAHADEIEHTFTGPDFDRWMYPFNFTNGTRESAVTFSSIGGGFDIFDDRDGQVLLGFITQEDVPAELGIHQYDIASLTLHITISNEGNIYDPTVDAWETYALDSDVLDSDAGRPFELFGTAFRGGYDGWSFGEDGSFPMGAERRERNAYPIAFTNDGDARAVSNNVFDEFTPVPFAVGMVDGIAKGGYIPVDSVVSFEVDVTDPYIQCYLKKACNEGLVNFCLTSLHEAQQPGLRGLIQPNFHMKESWSVQVGLVDAAQLSIVVEVNEEAGPSEDLDGDGFVGVSDVLVALGDWGQCVCCQSDINGDGEVNVSDLLLIIAAWNS